jgi:hypothetical protein
VGKKGRTFMLLFWGSAQSFNFLFFDDGPIKVASSKELKKIKNKNWASPLINS